MSILIQIISILCKDLFFNDDRLDVEMNRSMIPSIKKIHCYLLKLFHLHINIYSATIYI